MSTDELDEKTKSLNQSGVFLQMDVADQLKLEWYPLFEYPVRVSPFVDPISKHMPSSTQDANNFEPLDFVEAIRQSMNKETVKETSIDIVARKYIRRIGKFNLCIESKKLDSDHIEWVFFRKSAPDSFRCLIRGKPNDYTIIAELLKTFNVNGRLDTMLGICNIRQGYFEHPICDFGISLKEERVEDDFYKSDKTGVDQAARQIIEGTYGFTMDKIIQNILSGEPVRSKGYSELFIPIIITNANLSICEFNKEKIEHETGKITEKPNYSRVDSLIYECLVPKTVQFPESLKESISTAQNTAILKWHVLVFSPRGFYKFLNKV